MSRSTTLLACFLVIAGCGDDGGGQPDTSTGDTDTDETTADDTISDTPVDIPTDGAGLTLAEWCEQYENRYQDWRDWFETCCSAEDMASDDFDLRNPYSSDVVDVPGCMSLFGDRISDGSIVFNGARAEDCLVALRDGAAAPPAGCTGIPWAEMVLTGHGRPGFDQIPACRETFVGQIERDQPCSYGTDCVAPLRCRDIAGEWTCSDAAGMGGSCSLDGECEDGLFCMGSSTAKSCMPLSGVYGVCTWSYHCEDGLMCDYGENSCYLPGSTGDTCGSAYPDCEPGLMCDFMGTERCVALPSAGEYCMFAGTCQGRCDTDAEQCLSMCGSG